MESFPDILNVEFTAGMENELDKIEEGKEAWTKAMKRFYTPFSRDLKKAAKEMRERQTPEVPTDIACEKCGAMMVVKWGRNGEFLACPRYPECKNTKNFKRNDKGELHIAKEEEVNETCEQCGRPMQLKWGKYGKFLGCSGYPECTNIRPSRNRWTSVSNVRNVKKVTLRSESRGAGKSFTAAIAIPNVSSLRGIVRWRAHARTATIRFSSRK